MMCGFGATASEIVRASAASTAQQASAPVRLRGVGALADAAGGRSDVRMRIGSSPVLCGVAVAVLVLCAAACGGGAGGSTTSTLSATLSGMANDLKLAGGNLPYMH